MGGIEKLRVTESAKGTRAVVGAKHTNAERGLMQPALDGGFRVLAPECEVSRVKDLIYPLLTHPVLESHDKLVFSRFLTDEPDRIHRHVDAGAHPQEPHERFVVNHGRAKRGVVVGVAVSAAPLVALVPVRSNAVVVGTILGPFGVRGENAERCVQLGELTNAAHVSQCDSPTLELELIKLLGGDHSFVGSDESV